MKTHVSPAAPAMTPSVLIQGVTYNVVWFLRPCCARICSSAGFTNCPLPAAALACLCWCDMKEKFGRAGRRSVVGAVDVVRVRATAGVRARAGQVVAWRVLRARKKREAFVVIVSCFARAIVWLCQAARAGSDSGECFIL